MRKIPPPRKSNVPVPDFTHTPCTCGIHFGLGVWDAEKRAETYAWIRDVNNGKFSEKMAEYLKSYETLHGQVNWREK
jgi:hypothetical protein